MVAPLRASPRQRERAVRALGVAYRGGLLSTGTFELRLETALRAPTARQLRDVLADLPGLARLRLVVEDTVRRSARRPVPTAAAVNLVLRSRGPSRLSVGRDEACDVMFAEATVSRRHALFRRERGAWVLYDLGSTNGTWVNDVRIGRHRVEVGDEVRFGHLAARLLDGR